MTRLHIWVEFVGPLLHRENFWKTNICFDKRCSQLEEHSVLSCTISWGSNKKMIVLIWYDLKCPQLEDPIRRPYTLKFLGLKQNDHCFET